MLAVLPRTGASGSQTSGVNGHYRETMSGVDIVNARDDGTAVRESLDESQLDNFVHRHQMARLARDLG